MKKQYYVIEVDLQDPEETMIVAIVTAANEEEALQKVADDMDMDGVDANTLKDMDDRRFVFQEVTRFPRIK